MYTTDPGTQDGVQSGTVVLAGPRRDRSSDGVEPGHTPRPRVRSKGAHAVEFSKTVAPLREGDSFPGRVRECFRSRSGPMSIAPGSPRREGRARRGLRVAPRASRRRAAGLASPGARPGDAGRPASERAATAAPNAGRPNAYDRTCTVTVRRRGRSSKSIRTICCQVPSCEPAVDDRDRLRRADHGGAQMGVGVRVVVEAVVLVVAGARDQAVEQLLQVVDAARLVLHRRDRDGRAVANTVDHAAIDAGRGDDARDSRRDVDDVPVARRLHPEQTAVNGHGRPRRGRRNAERRFTPRARARSGACRAAGPCRRPRPPAGRARRRRPSRRRA